MEWEDIKKELEKYSLFFPEILITKAEKKLYRKLKEYLRRN